jgi:VanZ family protein
LWWLAIVLGVVATAAIEYAQQHIVGRVSDPRDLVANTTGAVLGALLALAVTTAKARRIAAAREAAA